QRRRRPRRAGLRPVGSVLPNRIHELCCNKARHITPRCPHVPPYGARLSIGLRLLLVANDRSPCFDRIAVFSERLLPPLPQNAAYIGEFHPQRTVFIP